MAQDRAYRKFDPSAYGGDSGGKAKPERDLRVPGGMDELLDEVDKVVGRSNLSEEYKQQGGQ